MLIGNVGKDPEVHFTPSGVKVAQLRLATSETWKDKDGAVQEHTDWHTIIAWRGLADVVERLVRRGSRLYVEGKIQSMETKSTSQRSSPTAFWYSMLNVRINQQTRMRLNSRYIRLLALT
jgi:single stranded DNA-binding protein